MPPGAMNGNGHVPHTNGNHAKPRNGGSAVSNKGRVFMLMLALQYGLQPLLQKACIKRDEVDRVSLVVAVEVVKIFLCSGVILASGPKVYGPMIKSWTLQGSLEAAAFPAAAYALQNCLAQLAYSTLDSLTFNLLNQTKTLFAALSLYLVMGKRQSMVQMFALSLMLVAALLLNAASGGSGGTVEATNGESSAAKSTQGLASFLDTDDEVSMRFWLGVLPVMGAAFLSGFTGAVTQRTLQRNCRNSSQLSLELAVYGVATLLMTSSLWGSGGGLWEKGFFRGWTPLTWLPVLSHAFGGLIVGQVTKHAGSLQKGFALIAGIFVTAVVQSTLEKSKLTGAHWMAAALVAGGTYLHANYPYRQPAVKATKAL